MTAGTLDGGHTDMVKPGAAGSLVRSLENGRFIVGKGERPSESLIMLGFLTLSW